MPISYNGYLQLLVNSNNTFTYCRGEVVCTVTTAKALDGAMAKEVEAALNSFLKKGQKAHIAYAVGLITLLKQYNSMDPVIPFILELDRISDPLYSVTSRIFDSVSGLSVSFVVGLSFPIFPRSR